MNELPRTVVDGDTLTVEGAGPELLGELLAEYEREFVAVGGVSAAFRPGRDSTELRADFRSQGIELHDELAVLYSWHDGENFDLRKRSTPRFEFWSTEAVLRNNAHPVLALGTEPWEWNPDWVQLMGDNNGMIAKWSAPSSPLLIRALYVGGANATQELEPGLKQVVSLCTPIAWWIEYMRMGVYKWHPDHGLLGTWHNLYMPMERRLAGVG